MISHILLFLSFWRYYCIAQQIYQWSNCQQMLLIWHKKCCYRIPHSGDSPGSPLSREIRTETWKMVGTSIGPGVRWARDRSLRMRRYERIDRVAVYQKCIKINAGAYYFCWNTRAFIARSVRRFIRGGICNANRATQNKARVHAAKPPCPGLLVLAYIVTRTFLLTHHLAPETQARVSQNQVKLGQIRNHQCKCIPVLFRLTQIFITMK